MHVSFTTSITTVAAVLAKRARSLAATLVIIALTVVAGPVLSTAMAPAASASAVTAGVSSVPVSASDEGTDRVAARDSGECNNFGYDQFCTWGKGTKIMRVWKSGRFSYVRFKNLGSGRKHYALHNRSRTIRKTVAGHTVSTMHVRMRRGNSVTNLRVDNPETTFSAGAFTVHRGAGNPWVTYRHMATANNGVVVDCVRNNWRYTATLNMGIDKGKGMGFQYRIYKDVPAGKVRCVRKHLNHGARRAVRVLLARGDRTRVLDMFVTKRP
jgi:hypothetical protein